MKADAKLTAAEAARQLLPRTEHSRDALPYTDEFERLYERYTRNGKLLAEHRTLPDGVTEAQLDDDWGMERSLMGLIPADISADGSTFAFCRYKVVQLFDVETGKESTKFEADPNGVYALALSPDGKRLAVGGRGKAIETRLPDGSTRHQSAKEHRTAVWDLAVKKIVWQTTSPGSWAGEVVFSPDGTRLAEVVDDEKRYFVRVWEVPAGKEIGRIELAGRGHHVAFDRTGKRLAVSSWDTTAVLFDLETALKPINPK
jgi:WD40 repeat protein